MGNMLAGGLLGTGPPDPTLESASPSILRGRFGIKIGSNQEIDVESMSNRFWIDAKSTLRRGGGEADSRVGSGGPVPNNPSQQYANKDCSGLELHRGVYIATLASSVVLLLWLQSLGTTAQTSNGWVVAEEMFAKHVQEKNRLSFHKKMSCNAKKSQIIFSGFWTWYVCRVSFSKISHQATVVLFSSTAVSVELAILPACDPSLSAKRAMSKATRSSKDFGLGLLGHPSRKQQRKKNLGPVLGRTDFSHVFFLSRQIISRIFLLLFVGKLPRKNPPGKSLQQKSLAHFCRWTGPKHLIAGLCTELGTAFFRSRGPQDTQKVLKASLHKHLSGYPLPEMFMF